jgi:NADPH-dependent 7-cyano-7-deazaguanine reductase QueF
MELEPQRINKPTAARVFTIEAPLGKGQNMTLQYVPDREMVACENFQTWLGSYMNENPVTIEELVTKVGNHFYDKVLPHYMDLKISYAREDGLTGKAHFIQHQPKYKLPEILRPVFNS